MLERPALLLRPWEPATRPHRSRVILDARTGDALGVARELPISWPVGLRWLAGTALAVYETEDESLLCTVRRLWRWDARPVWGTRDADGHEIGRIRHSASLRVWPAFVAWDRQNCPVARWSPRLTGDRLAGAESSVDVGNLHVTEDGLYLTFADVPQNDPFARMLILTAALTSDLR